MSYKEDANLPEWMKQGDTDIEKEFREWYEKEFLCDASPRSARYYQMRRAWIASKKHYEHIDMTKVKK
jgi:hypothetical protein